jgi:hypothetical protein
MKTVLDHSCGKRSRQLRTIVARRIAAAAFIAMRSINSAAAIAEAQNSLRIFATEALKKNVFLKKEVAIA